MFALHALPCPAFSVSPDCIALRCPEMCVSVGDNCQLHELSNVVHAKVQKQQNVACFVPSLMWNGLAWAHIML